MGSTTPRRHPRHRQTTAGLVIVLVAVSAWLLRTPSEDQPTAPVTPPWEVTSPGWEVLGGDVELGPDVYTDLASHHPGLDDGDALQVSRTAAAVTVADLTAQGRDQFAGYWPPAPTTSSGPGIRCSQVSIHAASPVPFEVTDSPAGVQTGTAPHTPGRWVKTLVAYTGECAEATYTTQAPGVAYVYGLLGGEVFTPVREWDIPYDQDPGDAQPQDWQLATVQGCATSDSRPARMRSFAAAAFTQLCRTAEEEGVVLVVESAYRTRTQQADLWDEAVEFYGSQEKAAKWVAYADQETCESRHCTGLAVNVEPDNAATTWLWQVVGCSAGGVTTAAEECEPGQTPVRRAQTFGFVLPYERIPGYAEFVLSEGDASAEPDCAPNGVGVDKMVASVFRCRLARAQVPPPVVEQVVAEALVVSRCASSWNAGARVFGGRYATESNPEDGRLYDEAGVFALRGALVDAGWVAGEPLDPVVNVNAAASMWLATRGWEQFGCATGTDPGFDVGPVLPQYGGPQLPEWSRTY